MTHLPIHPYMCIVCETPMSLAYEQKDSICPECQKDIKKAKAAVARKTKDGTKKIGGTHVILKSQIKFL